MLNYFFVSDGLWGWHESLLLLLTGLFVFLLFRFRQERTRLWIGLGGVVLLGAPAVAILLVYGLLKLLANSLTWWKDPFSTQR